MHEIEYLKKIVLKNDKANFKAALRQYLQTHSFYSADEYFMCKDDL